MNVLIEKSIAFLMAFLAIWIFNLCYAKLNNSKMNLNIKNLIFNLVITICIMISNSFNNFYVKTIINFITFCVGFKFVFKDNWKNICINYIVIYLLVVFSEIVITNGLLICNILNDNTSASTIRFINIILSDVVNLFVYSLLCISLIRAFLQKLISFFLENKAVTNIVYLMFLTIFIISIINVQNFANSNSLQLIFLLIFIFSLMFALFIHSKAQEEVLKISNKKLMDYNKQYGKFLDEYKIYKHNINNKLSAIKTYGNKKVNALIDEMLEHENNFSIRNNEIYNVPNGIKGIVAEKLYNKDYDVIIHNKIKQDPFSKLDPKTFNSISECLGIALDNATVACEETDCPIIVIDIYEDKDTLTVKVGNNFKNSIDLDKIGEKYYSTKNRGSGLGLFSIARNNLVTEKINIINNIYFIELQIKKAR